MTAYAAICDEGNLHKIAYRLGLRETRGGSQRNFAVQYNERIVVRMKSDGFLDLSLFSVLD